MYELWGQFTTKKMLLLKFEGCSFAKNWCSRGLRKSSLLSVKVKPCQSSIENVQANIQWKIKTAATCFITQRRRLSDESSRFFRTSTIGHLFSGSGSMVGLFSFINFTFLVLFHTNLGLSGHYRGGSIIRSTGRIPKEQSNELTWKRCRWNA